MELLDYLSVFSQFRKYIYIYDFHMEPDLSVCLCAWYLLVVELQGTNRDEEKRGVANPFWVKLYGGVRRLESCIQDKHQGGAYLWLHKPLYLWRLHKMFSLESDSKHEGATQTQTEWPKPALGKFSNFSFFLKGKEKKEDKKWLHLLHSHKVSVYRAANNTDQIN